MSKGQNHGGEIYRDSWTKLVETQEFWTDSCGACMGSTQALHMWETGMQLDLSEGHLAVGPGYFPGA